MSWCGSDCCHSKPVKDTLQSLPYQQSGCSGARCGRGTPVCPKLINIEHCCWHQEPQHVMAVALTLDENLLCTANQRPQHLMHPPPPHLQIRRRACRCVAAWSGLPLGTQSYSHSILQICSYTSGVKIVLFDFRVQFFFPLVSMSDERVLSVEQNFTNSQATKIQQIYMFFFLLSGKNKLVDYKHRNSILQQCRMNFFIS